EQTSLELLRLKAGKHRIEYIMRGDAMLQIEKLRQPLPFVLAEFLHLREMPGAANHRTQSNSHDIDQGMKLGSRNTRILQRGEMLRNRRKSRSGHHRRPPWPQGFLKTTRKSNRLRLARNRQLAHLGAIAPGLAWVCSSDSTYYSPSLAQQVGGSD